MSAAPGLERSAPAARPAPRPVRRPALALVPAGAARRRATRTPFAAVVVALLAAGLLGLLFLNTALAQDAFRLHTLKQDSRALQDREQVLTREVEALRAPQALAAQAEALGMVPAGPPAFLRLPDGAVLGAETAAPLPEPAPSPGAEADAPAAEAPAAGTQADAPAADAPAADTPAADTQAGEREGE